MPIWSAEPGLAAGLQMAGRDVGDVGRGSPGCMGIAGTRQRLAAFYDGGVTWLVQREFSLPQAKCSTM